MRAANANGATLHVQEDSAPKGAPVLFANALGTHVHLPCGENPVAFGFALNPFKKEYAHV